MKKSWPWVLLGLLVVAAVLWKGPWRQKNAFDRSMTLGAGYLEKGDATNAIQAFLQSVREVPESVDARLNLANAYLLGNQPKAVIEQCEAALKLDQNNAAAFYLMGCASLRLNQLESAIQAMQSSQKIDPAVSALNFQLGLAFDRAGHLEDAIREFETLAQFEPEHPSVHYQLSRLYQKAGREADAAQELARHQAISAKTPPPSGPMAFERCKYTQPRVAFALEQPEPKGISVRFVDATDTAFGTNAALCHGPIGVLDLVHDGRNSLFVVQSNSFRFLNNVQGRFVPLGAGPPAPPGLSYSRCLVGDLNNDLCEDVVLLGEQASHLFRFSTNGQFREVTAASGVKNLIAHDGVLADLDFTGKLDLLAVLPEGKGLRVCRNVGNFYFMDKTNSGLPAFAAGLEQVLVEDFHNEDVPGLFLTQKGHSPSFFSKQRAGGFVATNSAGALPSGTVLAVGDLNNDLRLELVVAGERELQIVTQDQNTPLTLPLKGLRVRQLLLVDYDNDGWLDLVACGDSLRVWRNLGKDGFADVTVVLGLEKVGAVRGIVAADFDRDGDTDFVCWSDRGLSHWRNDGGNANRQLKLQLTGTRSNASGLGTRVELVAGHWHTIRTLGHLPFEIGVGQHARIDTMKTRWFDLAITMVEVAVEPKPLSVVELSLPTGSCPYLYSWNGKRFRFVTDVLGASPLGLPMSETRYVEADPEEYIALGNDVQFVPKMGRYELRITEELREVLYLDHARLVVVDHPVGTLVHPTCKMVPGKPFPPHELWTLRPVASVRGAVRSDGKDVLAALSADDGRMVGPVRLREPQLRGLAEPFSVTMDFGAVPSDRPLVLVLHGWIRFGGGMANVAGSIDPSLPFPFPSLEAELEDGSWQRLAVQVGTPAGKTKTILVDLEAKLPPHPRRLRLSTAFELYLDSASLCVKAAANRNEVHALLPDSTDLHWRGFSDFEALPQDQPLTPDYDRVQQSPPWRRTPMGWCTRYGMVDDLVKTEDDALVLLNGGDELSLAFQADRLPSKPLGFERDFFVYLVGWDKDADYHVGQGWRVEPLPFHGLEDQAYGRQPRPMGLEDSWISTFNTRWVGPLVLSHR